MCLECGKKLEDLERTHTLHTDHTDHRPGIDPTTFIKSSQVNSLKTQTNTLNHLSWLQPSKKQTPNWPQTWGGVSKERIHLRPICSLLPGKCESRWLSTRPFPSVLALVCAPVKEPHTESRCEWEWRAKLGKTVPANPNDRMATPSARKHCIDAFVRNGKHNYLF